MSINFRLSFQDENRVITLSRAQIRFGGAISLAQRKEELEADGCLAYSGNGTNEEGKLNDWWRYGSREL